LSCSASFTKAFRTEQPLVHMGASLQGADPAARLRSLRRGDFGNKALKSLIWRRCWGRPAIPHPATTSAATVSRRRWVAYFISGSTIRADERAPWRQGLVEHVDEERAARGNWACTSRSCAQ
jgi:hypothetical protein